MAKLTIIHGSCADQQADVIVNAANSRLLQGGGICGTIFKKAGETMLAKACSEIKTPLNDGDAAITPSFDIKNAKAIIHAVGPDFRRTPTAFHILENAYFNALKVMKESGYHSISFPLISAGIYGGILENPPLESAKQCRYAFRRFVATYPDYDINVLLCAYSISEYESIKNAFDGVMEYLVVPSENDFLGQLAENDRVVIENGQKWIVDLRQKSKKICKVSTLEQDQEDGLIACPLFFPSDLVPEELKGDKYYNRYDMDWLIRQVDSGQKLSFATFWQADSGCENREFSQWYQGYSFYINGRRYFTAEQYMMSEKALFAHDYASYAKIMEERDPATCKSLGRAVSNLNTKGWGKISREVLFRGNLEKFRSDAGLLSLLMGTGDSILVEANPFDSLYGAGISKENLLNPDGSLRVHPRDWHSEKEPDRRAENKLGFVLMGVRDYLRNIIKTE